MTAILLPLLVMGCVFGGASVLVPAYIQHQHATFWLGPLLAATSIGGVIGGILYATTGWKAGLWPKYHLLIKTAAEILCGPGSSLPPAALEPDAPSASPSGAFPPSTSPTRNPTTHA
ncbi:hypothetical protein ACIP6I_28960 [Streptomyces anulatus]